MGLDVCGGHVDRLYRFQCFNVALVGRVSLCHFLGHGQLCAHRAGEVFLGQLVALRSRVLVQGVAQLAHKLLLRLSGNLRHVVKVYRATLIDRGREGILCGLYALHFLDGTDRALRENGRLRDRNLARFCVFAVVFDGSNLTIVRVIAQRIDIVLFVERAMCLGEGIIGRVEVLAQGCQLRIRGLRINLCLHQCIQRAADLAKVRNEFLLGRWYSFCHAADRLICLAVLHHVGIVTLFYVGDNLLRVLHRAGRLAMCWHKDVLRQLIHGLLQCLSYILGRLSLCRQGETLAAAAIELISLRRAEHILLVLAEIFVEFWALPCAINLGGESIVPFLCILRRFVRVYALLQDNDIRGYRRASLMLERLAWQLERTNKVRLLACLRAQHLGLARLGLHRARTSNEYHKAAGAHFVQRLGNEVIVNQVSGLAACRRLCIGRVINLYVRERDIRDCQVEEVIGQPRVLIAVHRNAGLLIQLLGNSACQWVELYAVKVRVCLHVLGHDAEETACTHRRVKYATAFEAEALEPCPHRLDNLRGRIERIQ